MAFYISSTVAPPLVTKTYFLVHDHLFLKNVCFVVVWLVLSEIVTIAEYYWDVVLKINLKFKNKLAFLKYEVSESIILLFERIIWFPYNEKATEKSVLGGIPCVISFTIFVSPKFLLK